jgi:2-iminobutanoate/2-iminopropanoate deaminase
MITVHASTPRLESAMAKYGIKNSTAIQVGDLIMFSGLTGLDLETGKPVEGDTAAQARHTLGIFRQILEDLGLTLDHVVKVNAHLVDLDAFGAWNEVFLDVFDAPYPCRTTVGAPLVVGLIEIEITAATQPRR